MADKQQARTAFSNISNTIGQETAAADEETNRREERNRKQREYRARKRAEETAEQREERNRKQREYHARKKTPATSTTPGHEPCDVEPISGCTDIKMTEAVHSTLPPSRSGGKSPQESVVSAICQATIHSDQENDDPVESGDWLHRNENYVRKQRPPLMPLQTESPNGTVINTGASSSTDKLRSWRNWYLNMDATTQAKLLQQKRDYKKARATENHHRKDISHMPMTAVQPRFVDTNDEVEFDTALFEPTNNDSDDVDHLCDIEEEFDKKIVIMVLRQCSLLVNVTLK